MVGPILPCLPRFVAQAILGVFSLYTPMSIDDNICQRIEQRSSIVANEC